ATRLFTPTSSAVCNLSAIFATSSLTRCTCPRSFLPNSSGEKFCVYEYSSFFRPWALARASARATTAHGDSTEHDIAAARSVPVWTCSVRLSLSLPYSAYPTESLADRDGFTLTVLIAPSDPRAVPARHPSIP